ncbi:MAG: glycosyltransferase family 4 protein [Niabella sp.]
MSQKQKVLIIENSQYITGGFKAIFSLTEALKDKIEFYYVIPKGSKVKTVLQSSQYPVEELRMLEISKQLKTFFYLPVLFKNARYIIKFMKEHAVNILHVNDIYNQLGCAVKFKQPAIKVIYHVRLLKNSYISTFYSLFSKMINTYADKIICVSQAVYKDIGSGKKAVVLYDRPAITHKYASWDGLHNPQKAKILYLGNYIPGKGQQLALQVIKNLISRYPAISLHFYGDTQGQLSVDYIKALKAYTNTHHLSAHVVFNHKTNDVEHTMKEHDLILNMSSSESFSFVCLEALLYGIPLVATNSGGPAEITDYGKMAQLVPNNDITATENAIKKILDKPDEYILLSRSAKVWAAEYFNFNTTVGCLYKMYTEQ